MGKYFAQASIDENGRIAGGQAGNQNGKELNTRELYSSSSRPWLFILRALDAAVQAEVNRQFKAAVSNPFIGYDQNQRNSILPALRAANWQMANINTPCETDCSALGAACIIAAVYVVLGSAAGDEVYNALYAGGNLPATSNMKQKALNCGKYIQVLPFSGFGSMQVGDVVTRDGHTVGCVDSITSSNGLKSGTTASSLASSSYPCKGWTGDQVRKLQSALVAKGYSCGNCGVDGSFGNDTHAAVLKFQADNGLETDGIVGPKTQAKLYGGSNASQSGSGSWSNGTYVTTVGGLNVRTSAGTGYARKSKSQLTADGQRHSNDQGQLNSGTKVTVMQVQYDGSGNPWGMIPSGWICLQWNGKQYAKRA